MNSIFLRRKLQRVNPIIAFFRDVPITLMNHTNSFSVNLNYKLTATSEIAGMLLVCGNSPVREAFKTFFPLLIQLMGISRDQHTFSVLFVGCSWFCITDES